MMVVLDTNVIVSGIINPHGIPAKILNMVINGKITLVLYSRIFSEYKSALTSPKFSFPKEYVNVLLEFIKKKAVFVSPAPANLKPIDLSGLPFIEVALEKKIPLITGNKKHFRAIENLKVYSLKEFMKRLQTPHEFENL